MTKGDRAYIAFMTFSVITITLVETSWIRFAYMAAVAIVWLYYAFRNKDAR